MKCKVCGYNIPEDKKYCPLCGTPKNSAPEVEKSSAVKEVKTVKEVKVEKEAKAVKKESPVQDELTKAFAEVVSKEKNTASKPVGKVVSLKNNGFDIEPIEKKPLESKPAKKAEKAETPKREHRSVSEAFKYEPKPVAAQTTSGAGPIREHRSVGEALKDLKKPEGVSVKPEDDYIYNMFVKIPRREADKAAANQKAAAQEQKQPAAKNKQTPLVTISAQQAAVKAQEEKQKAQQEKINTLRYDHPFEKADGSSDWQNRPLPMPANQDITMRYPAYRAPEDPPAEDFEKKNKPEEKRPERFNTFVAKNAEFQTLLNQEYERIKNLHKDEPQDDPEVLTIDEILHPNVERRISPENFAANISSMAPFKENAKKSGNVAENNEPIGKHSAEHIAAHKETTAAKPENKVDKDKKDSVEDLVAEVSTAMGDNAFKRNTVEMKIAEMKRNEQAEAKFREERRKRLAEMEAARKAYFEEQDQLHPEFAPKASEREDSDIFNPIPKTPVAAAVIAAENHAAEKEIQEQEDEENITKKFDPVIDKQKYAQPQHTYNYEEEERIGIGKYLLRFFLILILAVCACELLIRFMDFFLPNLAVTKTVLDIEKAVLDALRSLLN